MVMRLVLQTNDHIHIAKRSFRVTQKKRDLKISFRAVNDHVYLLRMIQNSCAFYSSFLKIQQQNIIKHFK